MSVEGARVMETGETGKPHSSSFRDPDGFIFVRNAAPYRQVNKSYAADYDLLISSGLYTDLSSRELLVRHVDVDLSERLTDDAYKVLKPEFIPFISYPYEWCFSELQDAALLTLQVQQAALSMGLSLKDASAFNVQFLKGKPIFIDTTSFERYEEGKPWVAYRQFCQHFLMPLALMSYCDLRCNQMLREYLDGSPLDLGSSLLPWRSKLRFGLFTHLHLHGRLQSKGSGTAPKQAKKFTKYSFLALIDNLKGTVSALKPAARSTTWDSYYSETNYTEDAREKKEAFIHAATGRIKPRIVWDLGANNGHYSRIAAAGGALTISFDFDPRCVEQNYQTVKAKKESSLLPLVFDLMNPTPALGWSNTERSALPERGPADLVLCLALVHHLAIGNNVPLEHFFEHLRQIARHAVVEFVPKQDSQVQRLLSSRKDIFPGYTQEGFEKALQKHFSVLSCQELKPSSRLLYLLERRP